MLKTVEGFYRDGKVEPTQPAGEPMVEDRPGAIGPSQVLVTFLEPQQINAQQLQADLEQIETLEGIQRGLADVETGNVRPLSEFETEMRQKYGMSG
jgi:hypothetical protein